MRRGMPWGIVTNGNGRNQRAKCRAQAGLEALTHFIIVSEEQGYAKPDPRIYQDAMSALGLERRRSRSCLSATTP